jgi:adenylate cyclase
MHDPARILIVDDNPTNRDILATRLAAHGYELSQAADGEEALAAIRKLLPDLVLLDVMMPKLSGVDACRLLKNDTTLPFIPVILVTAKADSKDIVAGLEAGADEYLTKPVDQAALVARQPRTSAPNEGQIRPGERIQLRAERASRRRLAVAARASG